MDERRNSKKMRIRKEINKLVKEFYKISSKKFIPGTSKIHYSGPIFDHKEINAVVNSLLDGWLAAGKSVYEFEKKFSKYIGSKDVVTTNSGSSANLLAMSALKNEKIENFIKEDEEVITPALTFPTTTNAVILNNLIPVFLDVEVGTYNIIPEDIESAITDKTKAILLVHMLGNPCNMKKIMKIANDNNLFVVEDCCDGHGSEYNRKKIGTFGDMGTFSFYCAHALTMVEGGAITVNKTQYAPILRSLRTWGRACACPICYDALDPNYLCPIRFASKEFENYDKRYLFINIGYNLKLLELQGAWGLEQLKRIGNFKEKRTKNFNFIYNILKDYEDLLILPMAEKNSSPCWFSFPITVRENLGFTRADLVDYLEKSKIETRSFMTGNILKQPAYQKIKNRAIGDLKNSDLITKNSFFIGCYPGLTKEMLDFIGEKFTEFLDKHH
jgi:CDP-6-deoxy-D-xylo-4-hexulose-3-dehydrase